MKCGLVQKMLPAFLEGVLSKTENALVENHMSACDACRAAFEEYRRTRELIGGLEEVEPPPGFARKVMARVEDEERRRSGILRKLFYPLHIKVPVQAAAAVAVAVLAIQAYRAVEPPERTVPQTAITAAPAPRGEPGEKGDLREEAPRPEKKAVATPGQETRVREGAVKDAPATPPSASVPPAETRLRKEEAAALSRPPAGPAAAKESEREEVTAGGKRAKTEVKARGAAPSREAASLQGISPVGLTLQTGDPARAAEKVQNLLREIGGSRIEVSRLREREIVTAELDPARLPLLLDRLRSLGEMKEKTERHEPNAPSILIRIEVFRE
jgi:hypothetical protein